MAIKKKIIIILTVLLFSFSLIVLKSNLALKYAFPMPHHEVVKNLSNEYGVDSLLIYSIIKTESKFQEKVKSPKGALGLMQIMPETGEWISGKMGKTSFDFKCLENPEENLEIGIWYYKYLLEKFEGQEILALAAYNGGESNVKKWLREGTWSGSLEDIEQIPFKETKNYVNKVLTNYFTYNKVYEKNK